VPCADKVFNRLFPSRPGESAGGPAHSKTLARPPNVFNFAKRLECGVFTAALARTTLLRSESDLRALESGAKATALQTLARLATPHVRGSVLDCGGPPPLFPRTEKITVQAMLSV